MRIIATVQVKIGDNCLIGDEVIITDNDFHGVGGNPPKCGPVTIGDNVWITPHAIILKGVEIGDHRAIGAGAVVTHSIPPNSFAAGVPARVISTFGHR